MKYQEYQNIFKYLIISMFLLFNLASASTPGLTSNWQLICFISLAIVGSILALGYAIAEIGRLEGIKGAIKQEAVQLVFTVIGVLFFTSFMFIITDQIMPGINAEIGTEGDMVSSALEVTELNLNKLNGYSNSLVRLLEHVGEQSSKTASCSFHGVGFSISTCSAFSTVQNPLTQALNFVYIGVVDLSAQLFILEFSQIFMFAVILPIGLIFRSFHFTRQAGGILIAIALGFGLIFPFGVLMNQYLVDGLGDPTIQVTTNYMETTIGVHGGPIVYTYNTCDEFDPGGTYDKAIKPGLDSIFAESFYGRLIKNVLFRSLIFTIFNLLITLTFISWTAGFLGAVIDLSVLTRLA